MTGTFLEMTFIYIINATEIEFDSVKEVLETVPPQAKSNIMTTYEKIIQYGKKEGKIEGKIEGKTETQKEIVLRSSDQGLPLPLIANITNLTEEEVNKILIKHKKA